MTTPTEQMMLARLKRVAAGAMAGAPRARLGLGRRLATSSTAEAAPKAAEAAPKAAEAAPKAAEAAPKGWWSSASFWGACGAAAGWGMSGSAIYDSQFQGPEVISMKMTPVMIVYSSLFARWAMVVSPANYALAACHATNVVAQSWQMYRAINHKLETGGEAEVQEFGIKAGVGAVATVGLVASAKKLQASIVSAKLGSLSAFAAAPAGPFTVHFWAPMSKWLISGASFLELDRPTDKISLTQYSALTATGFFFSRYALLVTPINYVLCSVNIALFGSSAWHLGRKVNADYISK